MVTRSKDGIFKPEAYQTDLVNSEPSTIAQALGCLHWRKAMEEEYE